jgi:predicted DNA-binding transcriptional regulator YafY
MGVRRVPVVKPDRLYALKLLLERGQCVPMSDILQRLEISRATAKRDLEFLRDRMGVPVQWDAFGRGYCIRCETRRPEGAPHELPGLWFTDQEVAALLTMYELVAEADDTGQVRQDLLSLQRRLQRMLGGSRSELQALLGRAQGAARKCGTPQGQDSSGCGLVRLPSEQGVAVSSD